MQLLALHRVDGHGSNIGQSAIGNRIRAAFAIATPLVDFRFDFAENGHKSLGRCIVFWQRNRNERMLPICRNEITAQ